ncbi:DNA-binding MarR family transcriptional regulator [Arthrobacter globiformis]|uniref:MarR family winged helix-turn-helix transcriptional regulator n=1 Tax=Arthrobacter globiformis TaxID=1665 RepID=UPI00278779F8|nr:MarR family transcriptional regulator [Arthrobacter globiformis]MDQ1057461.1 DNA-binding MarR family transcriptional regulator [Arthrobacter globiformis]
MVPNPDAEQWGPHQLLSMAARLVQRRQDQALAELGLTHAAVIALQGLLDGPLNQEELAAAIKVRSQSIGRVLSRLEGAGLVVRESRSQDRRHNEVSITEAGRQALEAARKAEHEALPPDVVAGTALGQELARVISYFPGRSKVGSTKNENPAAVVDDPAADDTAEAESPAAGAPAEGARPTEGAKPTEVAQAASGEATSGEPALRTPASDADEAGQEDTPPPGDRAGTRQKRNGRGDPSPE